MESVSDSLLSDDARVHEIVEGVQETRRVDGLGGAEGILLLTPPSHQRRRRDFTSALRSAAPTFPTSSLTAESDCSVKWRHATTERPHTHTFCGRVAAEGTDERRRCNSREKNRKPLQG